MEYKRSRDFDTRAEAERFADALKRGACEFRGIFHVNVVHNYTPEQTTYAVTYYVGSLD